MQPPAPPNAGATALRVGAVLALASTSSPASLVVWMIGDQIERARARAVDVAITGALGLVVLAVVTAALALAWPAPAWPLAIALPLAGGVNLLMLGLALADYTSALAFFPTCAGIAQVAGLACVIGGGVARARAVSPRP